MPTETRDKILTLGKLHAKKKRKMPGNRALEEHRRRLYDQVEPAKAAKRASKLSFKVRPPLCLPIA